MSDLKTSILCILSTLVGRGARLTAILSSSAGPFRATGGGHQQLLLFHALQFRRGEQYDLNLAIPEVEAEHLERAVCGAVVGRDAPDATSVPCTRLVQ